MSQCSWLAHYPAYCRLGTGNCDGAVNDASGKPIEVPCDCPPSQAVFNQHLVADVLAGHAVHNPTVKVNFPLDNSTASLLSRFNAASDTLQNLNGPGQGCPIVSTTFQAQVAAINAGKPLPQPVVPPSSPSPKPTTSSSSPARSPSPAPVLAAAPPPAPSTSGTPTPAQIEALAPQLGFTSGKNPTGELIFFDCCDRVFTIDQELATVMVPSTVRMGSRLRYLVIAHHPRLCSIRYCSFSQYGAMLTPFICAS